MTFLLWLKGVPGAVWRWLKKWWWAVLTGIGVIVGAVVSATIYRRKVNGIKDALTIERAKGDIKALRARREELEKADEMDEDQVADIDQALEFNRAAIAEVRRQANVPDDELAQELERLGYGRADRSGR